MGMWRIGDGPAAEGSHVDAVVAAEQSAAALGLTVRWKGVHDGLFACDHSGPCATVFGRHDDELGGELFSFDIVVEVA